MASETMIGPYQVIEQIGSGGMATVYKAYQPKLDRPVAIKVLHPTFTSDKQFLTRFEREARIVARLDHPNIVPVYDYDEHEGSPYLVMKIIEGVTLKDLLRKSTLSSDETLQIMEAVASALHYAHQQGILHRDVKPSNIILDKRGTPYLTDFGLARIAQAGESTLSVDSMLGTPHYISPEQAQAEVELDARTDVYSLGVVLYELVTGQVPFASETSYAIIHSHIYTPPPPPRDINPNISPEVERVILKALEKKRDARYSTPLELVEAYKRALQGKSVAAPARREPPQQTKPSTGKVVHVPRSSQGPQPPEPPSVPSPWAEVGDELRSAGDEIKEAFRDIGKSFQAAKDNKSGSRYMWRPGSKWTTAPDGKQGFYTEDELRAIEDAIPDEVKIRRRVEKRLKERQDLMGHMTAYVGVNLMMIFIWAATSPGGYFWPLWVLGPWGFGLAMHALSYYNEHGRGRYRREVTLQREIEAERRRVYGDSYAEKAKNEDYEYDDAPPRLRLNEDGEFTDSLIEELDERDKRKRQ